MAKKTTTNSSVKNKSATGQTTKKNTSARGSSSKNATSKKPAQNQKKAEQHEQMNSERNAARRQVVSSILFAVALLLTFVTIVPSGVAAGETNLWQGLKNIFFGLFGVCAFSLPIMLFYTSYVLAKDRPLNSIALRICGIATSAVCMSSILHIASKSLKYLKSVTISEQLTTAWHDGLKITNGGAAGALVGGAFARMFGKMGGLITVIVLLFALAMLLTGTSLPQLFSMLSKPFSKATDYTQQRIETKRINDMASDDVTDEKDEFVPPVAKPKKKTNKKYRAPNPDEVLKPSLKSSFFSDDFDPVPEKKNELLPFDNVDEEPDDLEIPVFSPPPDGSVLASPLQPKGTVKAEKKTDLDLNVPIPFGDNHVEIVKEDNSEAIEEQSEEKPASNVIDLIEKVVQAPENSVVQKTLEDTQEHEEHKRIYVLPGLDCLAEAQSKGDADVKEELTANAAKLVETLRSFNIETKIVDIARGPSVTRYEIQPAPGIKISRIAGLADDIAMNLAASGVRIEAPIPNKAAVGIEIPNRTRKTVTLREIIDSPQFKNAKSKLNVALGKDISGNVNCTDLAKMPHLLIAGTTGSGKSVCLNAMIISILFNSTPDEVKLVMIDPKQVEFTIYNGIPHLMVPVVSDARKAAGALSWAVSEMLKRYKMFSEKGVRDISGYNKLAAKNPEIEPMYQICIFIDELSDLMMVAQNEVEDSICRLAQMARAAGMHLVIATQRPSVDVITGIIKANIPSRIALYVSSQVDSRTILDVSGAEKLLGNGDMLFNPVGVSKPVRLQGCFVSDEEVERVVDFIKTQEECEYDDEVMEEIERQAVVEKKKGSSLNDANSRPDGGADEETMRAIAVVVENQLASTTLLQRKLKIGYAKAARIMDELEEKGIIGPFEGSKPRKVLMSKQQFNEMRALNDDTSFVAVDTTGVDEE